MKIIGLYMYTLQNKGLCTGGFLLFIGCSSGPRCPVVTNHGHLTLKTSRDETVTIAVRWCIIYIEKDLKKTFNTVH